MREQVGCSRMSPLFPANSPYILAVGGVRQPFTAPTLAQLQVPSSLGFCFSHTRARSLSLSLSLSHTHMLTLSISLSLFHTHTHTHLFPLSSSLLLLLSLSRPRACSHICPPRAPTLSHAHACQTPVYLQRERESVCVCVSVRESKCVSARGKNARARQ